MRIWRNTQKAVDAFRTGAGSVLYRGDCAKLMAAMPDNSVDLTVTSPPYCIGKAYDTCRDIDGFSEAHRAVLPEVVRLTKPGGSICWQVGYHVSGARAFPLDYLIFEIMREISGVVLRNRIIWAFGHGPHGTNRLSGRHEVILWFTKGNDYYFDLDSIRVPQKYPGKRHYKGPKRGQWSGNPKGKNPGDLWEIPNVKAAHIEKTEHPCQFPVALAQRLIRAMSPNGGVVFDPFMGAGTSGAAAVLERRRFVGADVVPAYTILAKERIEAAERGSLSFRPIDRPIYQPSPTEPVAKRPPHFWMDADDCQA